MEPSDLSPEGGPKYHWLAQILSVDFDLRDIPETFGETTFEPSAGERERLARLLHEFTHYLQNTCTPWGAIMFSQFALALLRVSRSRLRAELWAPAWEDYRRARSRLRRERRALTKSDEDRDASPRVSIGSGLAVVIRGLAHPVDVDMIREHMAFAAECMFAAGDRDVDMFYRERMERVSAPRSAIYWALFPLFDALQYVDLTRGIYMLTAGVLLSRDPVGTLQAFIERFTTGPVDPGTSLRDVAGAWLAEAAQERERQVAGDEARRGLREVVVLGQDSPDHELAAAFGRLAERVATNLGRSHDGWRLASAVNHAPFVRTHTWAWFMNQYGVPIICFRSGVALLRASQRDATAGDPAEQDQLDLQLILGTAMVLEHLGTELPCPFYSRAPHRGRVPICESDMDEDACLSAPHEKILEPVDGEQCLYRNSILLLGLEDPARFDRALVQLGRKAR